MARLSEEAKTLINETHPSLVATADKAGRPNVSPKGSFRVLDDEHIVFADVSSPRTIANLQENPQISAIVIDGASNHGVRVWGPAEVLAAGEVFDNIHSEMAAHNWKVEHVVVVKVDDFSVF